MTLARDRPPYLVTGGFILLWRPPPPCGPAHRRVDDQDAAHARHHAHRARATRRRRMGCDLRKKPSEDVLETLQGGWQTAASSCSRISGSAATTGEGLRVLGRRQMHSTHGVHPEAPNEHIFRLSNDRGVGILGRASVAQRRPFERGVFSHVGYHIVRVAEKGGGTTSRTKARRLTICPLPSRSVGSGSVNSNSGVLHPVVHEHPISGRKSVYLHLGMTGAVFEVTPKADDATAAESLRLLTDAEMRHLFQTYNALLNAGFASPAHADLLGAAPRYDQRVEVSGLVAKPELNGRTGKVVGVLDRTNGRVSVELDAAKRRAQRRRSAPRARRAHCASLRNPRTCSCARRPRCTMSRMRMPGRPSRARRAAARRRTRRVQRPTRPCTSTRRATASLSTTLPSPARRRGAPASPEVGLRILHRTTIKAKIDFDRHIRFHRSSTCTGPTRSAPASGRAAASATGGMRPSPCRIDGCSKAAPDPSSRKLIVAIATGLALGLESSA